ncbi:hypothetical protein [Actinacidiphila oryziradicis]|uniref:hypothetical protein n=1 Tax=Actinacidiphila oryziradicis TaxID=2571141 RepID=UPI002AFE7D0B|nr:hypothetical protein [Actinacidiphila oryziradicis]
MNCANNTGTDNTSTQTVTQGSTKSQLAATGAGDTTFLLLGAGTMVAGGIGFRLMPRLINRKTAA